jgi:hypothetical protein
MTDCTIFLVSGEQIPITGESAGGIAQQIEVNGGRYSMEIGYRAFRVVYASAIVKIEDVEGSDE